MTDPRAWLILQQWFSPNFPTGGFAYSHGLDHWIDQNLLQNEVSVEAALRALLDFGSARNDAILLKLAYEQKPEADPTSENLPALATALCASKERLEETLSQGASFASALRALHGLAIEDAPHPIVAGRAASALAFPLDLTLTSYLQGWIANLAMIAQRLVPLSQTATQAIICALTPDVARTAQFAQTATQADFMSAAFAFDLASMRHETQEFRLCKT